MKIKKYNVLKICILVSIAVILAGCTTSRRTSTYPRKHHRCNCPHFSYENSQEDQEDMLQLCIDKQIKNTIKFSYGK